MGTSMGTTTEGGREGKDPSDRNKPRKKNKISKRRMQVLEGFSRKFGGRLTRFLKKKPDTGAITGRVPGFHGRGSRTGNTLG